MLLLNEDKCITGKERLIYDEACLDIINKLNGTVTVKGQYAECLNCDFKDYVTLDAYNSTSILIKTTYTMNMQFQYNNDTYCNWKEELFEHYRYGWNLTTNCTNLYIKQPSDNEYLPILSAFIILFFFGTIWYMVKCIYRCTKNTVIVQRFRFYNGSALHTDLGSTPDSTPLVVENPPSAHKIPNRLKSIDVFRGTCIILMIFVNYGGGQYWFFKHSAWNGLTVADLVFPWFIWVMGMSYSISLNRRLQRAAPRRELIIQVLRRVLLLIILGLVLNSHVTEGVSLSNIRIPGVLQHIALTYLFIGIIESIFTRRTINEYQFGSFNIFKDILVAIPQWIFVLACVVVHILVTFLADVPGCGRGYLGPGGLHEHGKFKNCTGGIAGYIDRAVFGKHMYQNATCSSLYETTVYFDPEGILSTLTSVFLGYMGFQAGRIYHVYNTTAQRTIRWTIWGVVTCLIGGILCSFSKNGGAIPLNKNLWSLSFVLVLGGLAFLIQAILYVLVDIKRKWGGRPFFYPGMNPLVLYAGHELFKSTFPFGWKLYYETHAAYLAMNLWGTALWIAVAVFLYKKNIFINI